MRLCSTPLQREEKKTFVYHDILRPLWKMQATIFALKHHLANKMGSFGNWGFVTSDFKLLTGPFSAIGVQHLQYTVWVIRQRIFVQGCENTMHLCTDYALYAVIRKPVFVSNARHLSVAPPPPRPHPPSQGYRTCYTSWGLTFCVRIAELPAHTICWPGHHAGGIPHRSTLPGMITTKIQTKN